MSTLTALDELIAPALDAYGDELARHRIVDLVTVAAEQTGPSYDRKPGHRYVGACGCGWTGDRSYRDRGTANRSAGLHRSAAEKRASRVYAAEVDRLLTESRTGRQTTLTAPHSRGASR